MLVMVAPTIVHFCKIHYAVVGGYELRILELTILSRFLRARQYNPEDALKQFSAARATQNADELVSAYDSISIEDFERCRKLVCSRIPHRSLLQTH
jgi:hypothetical protein